MLRALEAGKIVKMKITHAAYSLDPFVRIGPNQMRGAGLEIKRKEIQGPFETLAKALTQTMATPTDYPPDIRWGCLLYDEKENEVGSIFVGQYHWFNLHRLAIVNGKQLLINGSLESWFEENFLNLFNDR